MLPIFNHGVQGGGKVEYSMEEGGGFNFFNMGKASTMSYILLIIMTFLIQRFIGKKEIV